MPADLDSWENWNPFITRAGGELRQGGSIEVFIESPGGKGRAVKPRLMTVEPGRELRWVGVFITRGLFTGQHYFIIEPQDEGGVIFVHGEYSGGIMVPLMGGMLRKVELGFADMNKALAPLR